MRTFENFGWVERVIRVQTHSNHDLQHRNPCPATIAHIHRRAHPQRLEIPRFLDAHDEDAAPIARERAGQRGAELLQHGGVEELVACRVVENDENAVLNHFLRELRHRDPPERCRLELPVAHLELNLGSKMGNYQLISTRSKWLQGILCSADNSGPK